MLIFQVSVENNRLARHQAPAFNGQLRIVTAFLFPDAAAKLICCGTNRLSAITVHVLFGQGISPKRSTRSVGITYHQHLAKNAVKSIDQTHEVQTVIDDENQAASTLSSVEGLSSLLVLPHNWLPHAIVLSVVGLANLVLPSVADAINDERLIGPFLGGGLAMEVAFTATIAALAKARILHRIVVAVTLLVLVATSFLLGLQLMSPGVPFEVILLTFGLALGGFMLVSIVLAAVRLATGFTISHITSIANEPPVASSKFSIGFIMASTSAAAVIIATVHSTLLGSKSVGAPPFWIVAGAIVYLAFSMVTYLPCVWIALASRFRLTTLILLIAVLLVLTPAVLTFMHNYVVKLSPHAVNQFYAFSMGQVISSMLVLQIYRWFGFRLIRPVDYPR